MVNSLCDLYPDEVQAVIDKAYADGLVIVKEVTPDDIQDCLDNGLEAALEHGRKSLTWQLPDDIDRALVWCEDFPETPQSGSENRQPSAKKQAQKKKKKRKLAKASKRRNR